MRVLITGASGGIGRKLREYLPTRGHEVTPLHRGARGPAGEARWDPARGELDAQALSGFDAVVHLSGANIGKGRWTEARKRELRASRIDSTRLLVDRMRAATDGPRVLVCASAIGFYGDRGEDIVDESATRGVGFLADLVADWELEAVRAADGGIRVVSTRFGVLMAAEDLALQRLKLAFSLGVGGRLGSGRQWMSWVAHIDLVRAIEWVLTHDVTGAVNVVSPLPMRNSELTSALSRVLRRPALFPVPAFALKLVLGGSADELLLASQRVMPRRLLDAGFEFTLPGIEETLRAELRPGTIEANATSTTGRAI
ncbi:MAG: TIGR01777 family protein [Dehalococcoidia bacterium]|nr:TIGR01777 family protein [Dehalococcoidia bacterium]